MHAWLPVISGRVTTPGGSPITFTYRTAAVDTTDSNTYSFASQAIGPEADRSHVIVAHAIRRTGTTDTTSMTIGGVSATRIVQFQDANGTIAFYGAVVPTGTTATVVVNLDNTAVRCGIGVWSVQNLSSLVPVATTNHAAGSGTTMTLSLSTPSGDSIVLALGYISFGSTQEINWTGLTENADLGFESIADLAVASGAFSTSGSKTITATWGSSSLFYGTSVCLQ